MVNTLPLSLVLCKNNIHLNTTKDMVVVQQKQTLVEVIQANQKRII